MKDTGVTEQNSLPFNQILRRLRESAGITQAELADRAGLSVKAIGALESGRRRRPYPSTIRAIADALELTESDRVELAGSAPGRTKAPVAIRDASSSLPAAPTPIVGRDRELSEITNLMRSSNARLVTLTGPGGVGKSRLALEAASRLADHVSGRTAFVALAPLSDPALVLPTIAQTLELTESDDNGAQAKLAAHFGATAWFLVLDNLEHLLAVATDLADLLAMCPGLALLVTSRAPLRIRAEHEYPVRPLALPVMNRIPTLVDVVKAESVQLFLERARAAVPGFDLSEANYVAVAEICRRLDGLPLALELVAPRLRALGPTELLARLEHVLPVLVSGSRDLPQRQQTMQAAINWSYELLDADEQTLFRRLSVFAGGWTLDAAESITAWDATSSSRIFDLLSELVEQSLVVAETGQEATRYRMLQPIHEFAAQRVVESGESLELGSHHLSWCLALARQAEGELHGPAQQQWLVRLEQEHDNLRAALSWSQHDKSRKADELQLASALWLFWETRGHLSEGRRWLEHALSGSDDAAPDHRAAAFNAAGNLARDQGDHARAAFLHDASLSLRRELGDANGAGQSLLNLGNVMLDQGHYERASDYYEEALALFRDVGNDWDVANALNNMGIALGYRGDYEQATAFLEEALVLRERSGEAAYRARSLDALAVVLHRQGNVERAESLHREALALRRELADLRGEAISLRNLGRVARHRGDYSEAKLLIEESLRIRREIEDSLGIALSLSALADVARLQGDRDRAVALYCEGLALHRQMGNNEGLVEIFLGLAAIAFDDGAPERAALLLGASEQLREALAQPLPPVHRDDYERLIAGLQTALDTEQFELARQAGLSMSADQAITYALGDAA